MFPSGGSGGGDDSGECKVFGGIRDRVWEGMGVFCECSREGKGGSNGSSGRTSEIVQCHNWRECDINSDSWWLIIGDSHVINSQITCWGVELNGDLIIQSGHQWTFARIYLAYISLYTLFLLLLYYMDKLSSQCLYVFTGFIECFLMHPFIPFCLLLWFKDFPILAQQKQ